jgi:hypothetical protein
VGCIGGQTLEADANSRFAADEKTFFAQFGKDWTLDQPSTGASTLSSWCLLDAVAQP